MRIVPVGLALMMAGMAVSGAVAIPMNNLSIWLDASDLNGDGIADTDGEVSVSQWNDKSGNGIHFVQSSETEQPLRQVTAMNGLPGVVCDYDYVVADDPGENSVLDITTQLHFFAVARGDGSIDGLLCKGYGGGGSGEYIAEMFYGGGVLNMFAGDNGWFSSNASAVPLNTAVILEISFDSNLSSDNLKFYVNGNPVGTANATIALTPDDTQLYVGIQGGFNPLDGAIGDLLMYKGVLSNADRMSLGAYLQNKYQIEGTYPEPACGLLLLAGGGVLLVNKRRGQAV